MPNLVTTDFHGHHLLGVKDDRGVFVALKPIVEGMGLSWSGQHDRVRRDPILSEGIRVLRMPSARGEQDAVCLPLNLMHGFLFRIDASRVRAEIRDRVLLYQRECYGVLSTAFSKGAMAAERPSKPRRRTVELSPEELALKRVRETRLAFGIRAAQQVWLSSGVLPIVPAMHSPDQTDLPFADPSGERH